MFLPDQQTINELRIDEVTQQREIYISGYNITNIDFLKECTLIEKLNILYTKISSFPLENLTNLKDIFINNCCNLQNIDYLKYCFEIEQLIVEYLNITNISAVSNFKNIKILTIFECMLISDYEVLEDCTSLVFLQLCKTNISDISSIVKLYSLQTQILTDNNELPQQFQQDIKDDKEKAQELLKDYKKTQKYIDYRSKKQNQQHKCKYNKIGTNLISVQVNIQEFKNCFEKKIYQNKIDLVKILKLIIKFQ